MTEQFGTCKICSAVSWKHLFTKNGFEIIRCANCGIVCTHFPEAFDLQSIYDDSYFEGGQTDGYGNYAATANVIRKEFRKNVRMLRKQTHDRPGLKLLEIGSAYGFFLDEASAYFNCTGIEVSKYASEIANKNGHHIFNKALNEEWVQQLGMFDIAVMFDVIEHLPDPIETLKLLDRCMNQNGIIMLTTGDVDSFSAKIFGKRWRLMTPPQHTFFFSRKTLRRIFESLGYEIEISKRPWKFVPPGLMFYQLGNRLGFRVKALEKISRVALPVNLFDTLLVVARKK